MERLCTSCHAPLTKDDIGLHRKLVNRAATEFMCIKCLAAYFGITEKQCRELIDNFRAAGCSMFN